MNLTKNNNTHRLYYNRFTDSFRRLSFQVFVFGESANLFDLTARNGYCARAMPSSHLTETNRGRLKSTVRAYGLNIRHGDNVIMLLSLLTFDHRIATNVFQSRRPERLL